jgi:hypothetical protein
MRKLLLGETWSVPLGVLAVLIVGLALRGDGWWVGFVVLLGAVVTFCASFRGVS